MISFLKSWIEQITITVIIASIFELILPKGNLKKYIKVVLGVYVIFSITSPFVDSKALYNIENAKIGKFIDNITEKNDTRVNQYRMDSRLEELYINELEDNIKKKVKEYGYEVYKSDIDADFKNSSKSPGIYKINLVLKEGTSNIDKIEEVNITVGQAKENFNKETVDNDIENIKRSLAEYYNIDENLISINVK